jgi:glucosamine--fructose-6-phosphate aminotransferase (isomerizing)
MCGIVGYIGSREAASIILNGLKRLEYRGYDSAGLAVIDHGEINIRRVVGKLNGLEIQIANSPIQGKIGIGHTRWATHGEPSTRNAHPHVSMSGDVVIVHNGIVENFRELRDELIAEGVIFKSETDSEVIAQLIEKYLSLDCSLIEATRKTLSLLRGAHGIVAISKREPDRIIAARMGNAGGVVIGLGKDENYIASDLPAILEHTREVIYLESGQLAIVAQDSIALQDLSGENLPYEIQNVSWDPIAAEKGEYRHFMQKEIHEQVRSLTDTIAGRVDFRLGKIHLDQLNLDVPRSKKIKKIFITACGTASHCGQVGKILIERIARIPVEVNIASEFRYSDPILDEQTVVLSISQSGETADTLAAMEEARRKGSLCTLTPDEQKSWVDDLRLIPDLAGQTLNREPEVEKISRLLLNITHCLYLGRGINMPTAYEGALKLKEISYIHAEGYPAGEMKHGPIALIDRTMPVIVIAPKDPWYEKMFSQIEQAKARGGMVIAVATDGDEMVSSIADHVIWVPKTPWMLSPVITIIPLQLLAYHIAALRGLDVDQPRNLAKSVTVE